MQSKIGHIQFNVQPDNIGFYKDLFAFVGWNSIYDGGSSMGFADSQGVSFWFIGAAKAVRNDYDGPGLNHFALSVIAQEDVDQVAAFLSERGIAHLFDTPRHRPDFVDSEGQTYYQVMFETPDRILIEVVYTGPKVD